MKITLTLAYIGFLVLPIAANFPNEDPICHPFRCPSGTASVLKKNFQFTSTGCSAGQGGMMMGNNNPRANEKCCDLKNACFQICGITKDHCERMFEKCSLQVCDEMKDPTAAAECEKDLSLQKMMTKFGGCQSYDAAQGSSCECVKKDDAPKRRKQALQRFYEKYVPDSVHKVDSLAEKVDSTKKLAGLFTKLIGKYPKCIKSVEDPKKKYMDDIINGRINVDDLEQREVTDEL